MSFSEILGVVQILVNALPNTIGLFLITLVLSIPLGLAVTWLKKCKFKPIAWLMDFYILIMRGTPLMLQIIASHYAIPMILASIRKTDFSAIFVHAVEQVEDLESKAALAEKMITFLTHAGNFAADFQAGLQNVLQSIMTMPGYMFLTLAIAFILNYAAYFAEIFRGGIEGIPVGQYEAAEMLGMTKFQTFYRIILPQFTKRVLPATSNEVIVLVKDTSLANVIAFAEITMKAQQQMNLYSSLTPLFIAGVFYFIMNAVVTLLFKFFEKKFDYYK